jgi:hypothetical protein
MRKRGFRLTKTFVIVLILVVVLGILVLNSEYTGNVVKKVLNPKAVSQAKTTTTPSSTTTTATPKTTTTTKASSTASPKTLSSTEKASYLAASTSPPGTTDFYGQVIMNKFNNANGVSAPAGTIVSAVTQQNIVCGTFAVTNQNPGIGWYGFLHCTCGGDAPTCNQETISFRVNGRPAIVTGNTVWDETIKRVDLVSNAVCGDIDGDNNVDISDLSGMVDYLYISLIPFTPLEPGNVDGSPDGNIDISDLSKLIDYLYISFTPLTCNYQQSYAGYSASTAFVSLGSATGTSTEKLIPINLNTPVDLSGVRLKISYDKTKMSVKGVVSTPRTSSLSVTFNQDVIGIYKLDGFTIIPKGNGPLVNLRVGSGTNGFDTSSLKFTLTEGASYQKTKVTMQVGTTTTTPPKTTTPATTTKTTTPSKTTTTTTTKTTTPATTQKKTIGAVVKDFFSSLF